MILDNRSNLSEKISTIVKNKSYGFHQHVNFTRQASGKKGQKLLLSLEKSHSCIINRTHSTHREKTGGYRFLNNPRITDHLLIESLQQQCKQNCEGLHVIGIQDTTEYNYQQHQIRLKEDTLGVVGNNRNPGYFAHLMVTFDAATCLPQGISYCKQWSRDPHRKAGRERQYKNLPIEEKESYRWLEAADHTKSLLQSASHFTLISDRESDIYQLWDRIPDDKTDLIIRARGDRPLFDQPSTIIELLDKQSAVGSYTIDIKGDLRTKRSKRKALLNVRYAEVLIKKSRVLTREQVRKDYVSLVVVEAREDPSSCNADEAPIHWLLLTSHAVNDFEQACRIINWYSFRWQIEQFFRLTKSQGINLESSQLETGDGLKKLGVFGFASALKILQMTLARDGIVNDRVQKYFNPQEVVVLHVLDKELKGTTLKQQNPHRKDTLAWASWIIARLGGYSGYASQSPPGPLTYKWGLDSFYQTVYASYIFKKDVYKE
jgi:hypothetical protein